MSRKKVSRNDPCPCGSGKKFKHCCISKGIDWDARANAGTRRLPHPAVLPPVAAPPSGLAALRPHRVVDTRLREIAKASPGPAPWKEAVERLSDTTPDDERMAAYRAVREAGVLPDEAACYLADHAIQWMPLDLPDPEEEPDDETDDGALDQRTVAVLRRHGFDDMAELYLSNRLEYDRRAERGRQFFYGPPDKLLARSLREKGIID